MEFTALVTGVDDDGQRIRFEMAAQVKAAVQAEAGTFDWTPDGDLPMMQVTITGVVPAEVLAALPQS